MARNRIIYQSEALFISQFGQSVSVDEHIQLSRIQSFNYGFSVNRQDVNQYGQLSRIGVINLDDPVVNVDFSYYLTDGYNEKGMGFYVQDTGSALGFLRFLPRDEDGVNLYLLTAPEGEDINSNTGLYPYVAIGNVYPTDYTLDISVGNIPTVSVSFEGSNILSSTMTGAQLVKNPAYDIDGELHNTEAFLPNALPITGASIPSALRPGDVSMTISPPSGAISNLDPSTGLHIQSFSLNIPLSRTPLSKIGRNTVYNRSLDTPINSQGTIEAIVADVQATNVAEILNSTETFDINVSIANPTGGEAFSLDIKGAVLQSESFSSSIGSNKTSSLVFETQLGGMEDTITNVLVSGSHSSGAYPYDAFLINNNEVYDASGQLILVEA
jgi:hypothetical protein